MERNIIEGRRVSERLGDNPKATHRAQLADKIAKLRLTRVPSYRHRKLNKAKAKSKAG